jgi:hypothetical protein
MHDLHERCEASDPGFLARPEVWGLSLIVRPSLLVRRLLQRLHTESLPYVLLQRHLLS